MGQCFNCQRPTPVLFNCTVCRELVCYVCLAIEKPQVCRKCQPQLVNTGVQSHEATPKVAT